MKEKAVAKRHLGIRLTDSEALLLAALVWDEQTQSRFSRVTLSSFVKQLALQEAIARKLKVVTAGSGKRRGKLTVLRDDVAVFDEDGPIEADE
jgi:hypothetical protein